VTIKDQIVDHRQEKAGDQTVEEVEEVIIHPVNPQKDLLDQMAVEEQKIIVLAVDLPVDFPADRRREVEGPEDRHQEKGAIGIVHLTDLLVDLLQEMKVLEEFHRGVEKVRDIFIQTPLLVGIPVDHHQGKEVGKIIARSVIEMKVEVEVVIEVDRHPKLLQQKWSHLKSIARIVGRKVDHHLEADRRAIPHALAVRIDKNRVARGHINKREEEVVLSANHRHQEHPIAAMIAEEGMLVATNRAGNPAEDLLVVVVAGQDLPAEALSARLDRSRNRHHQRPVVEIEATVDHLLDDFINRSMGDPFYYEVRSV